MIERLARQVAVLQNIVRRLEGPAEDLRPG